MGALVAATARKTKWLHAEELLESDHRVKIPPNAMQLVRESHRLFEYGACHADGSMAM